MNQKGCRKGESAQDSTRGAMLHAAWRQFHSPAAELPRATTNRHLDKLRSEGIGPGSLRS